MPNYTYINEAGQRSEFIKPIGTSDFVSNGVRWIRVSEPEGFRMQTGASLPDQRDQIKRGYKRLEDRGWNSKFSKQQIKKAWDI